jgi:2-phospho-L-lactate/phosphoenolpyruvate guanylyltransferase
MKATVVLPVKRFGAAKRRLAGSVDDRGRALLLAAMLEDVLAAIDRADAVERIVTVTGERRAERIAMRSAQRLTTPIEVLRDPSDQGHCEAATLGVVRAKALGAECAALLPGDCPLLDAAELDAALERADTGRVGVIPDRHGEGTNGLVLSPPDAIAPAFGPGSKARHLELAAARGLRADVDAIPSLGLDLDTPDDLAELRDVLARDPASAPRTAAVLAEL